MKQYDTSYGADTQVAVINGVGGAYFIHVVETDEYDVLVASGPVSRVLARSRTWAEAMDFVRDEIAAELDAEDSLNAYDERPSASDYVCEHGLFDNDGEPMFDNDDDARAFVAAMRIDDIVAANDEVDWRKSRPQARKPAAVRKTRRK